MARAGLGLALTIVGLLAAPLIVDAMGASDAVRPHALTYLRIGLLGAVPMLLSLAAPDISAGCRTPAHHS